MNINIEECLQEHYQLNYNMGLSGEAG